MYYSFFKNRHSLTMLIHAQGDVLLYLITVNKVNGNYCFYFTQVKATF